MFLMFDLPLYFEVSPSSFGIGGVCTFLWKTFWMYTLLLCPSNLLYDAAVSSPLWCDRTQGPDWHTETSNVLFSEAWKLKYVIYIVMQESTGAMGVTTLSACIVCVAAFLAGGRGRRVAAPGFVSHTWQHLASELLKALLASAAVSLFSQSHHPGFWLLYGVCCCTIQTLHMYTFIHSCTPPYSDFTSHC